MKLPALKTIADRINYLLKEEGISTYEFCKNENLLKHRRAFEHALTKGKGDNVNASFIKIVYNRYKDKISMIWLLYGDDDETVNRYLRRIKELEKYTMTLKELINTSYYDIKRKVEAADKKINELS